MLCPVWPRFCSHINKKANPYTTLNIGMCMHMDASAYMYMEVRGSPRVASLATLCLIFLRQGVSPSPEITNLAGPLMSRFRSLDLISNPPSAELTGVDCLTLQTGDRQLNSGPYACTGNNFIRTAISSGPSQTTFTVTMRHSC